MAEETCGLCGSCPAHQANSSVVSGPQGPLLSGSSPDRRHGLEERVARRSLAGAVGVAVPPRIVFRDAVVRGWPGRLVRRTAAGGHWEVQSQVHVVVGVMSEGNGRKVRSDMGDYGAGMPTRADSLHEVVADPSGGDD